METTDLKIQYYPKRTHLLENGEAPLFIRLKLNEVRLDYAAHRSVNLELWDNLSKYKVGENQEVDDLNKFMLDEKNKILTAKNQIEVYGESLTLDNIRSRSKKEKVGEISILQLYDEHNESCENLHNSGVRYAEETIERYKTARKHLADYIKSRYNKNDYPIRLIDNKFMTGFIEYLETKPKKCSNNTTVRYYRNVRKIINLALTRDIITKDPCRGIKLKMDEVDVCYLNKDELYRLINKEITIKRVDAVRDIYLFCCMTGLAYSDVKELKTDHLYYDSETGHTWIKKKRKKTKVLSRIRLVKTAKNILAKYQNYRDTNNGKLLPVLTNQRMNSYLEDVASKCDIEKELTTHTARHTFATTVALSNGMTLEAVAGALGHTTTKLTGHYAKTEDKLISDNFDKIDGLY